MKKLWAPWRNEYLKICTTPSKGRGCVFCRMLKEKNDSKNYILWRGKKVFAVLNLYPYNNGHVMIVVNRHTGDYSSLEPCELTEMMQAAGSVIKALKEEFKADGCNIGMNLGKIAGAGIKDHLHLHVVPRWNGDTNFLPVIGGTKVICESLEASYDKLKKYFPRQEAARIILPQGRCRITEKGETRKWPLRT